MTKEIMRIFFPLKITTYHESEYGYDESPEEISPAQAVAYEDAILAAIAKVKFTSASGTAASIILSNRNRNSKTAPPIRKK